MRLLDAQSEVHRADKQKAGARTFNADHEKSDYALFSLFLLALQSSCLFWMPAQAVNFLVRKLQTHSNVVVPHVLFGPQVMPPSMRVVYISTCSFLWINLLCMFKRGAPEVQKQEGAKETAN